MSGDRCTTMYAELCSVFPGGVNSPFRAFDQVGGAPPIITRGLGARIWDLDDREFIDLCCAWGPLVLGHAHPAVVEAARQAVSQGCVFGAPTAWELELARLIGRAFPSMEMMRLVNSGAEAVMSALRVARSATGRSRILKFEGCYHGHVECLDAVGEEAEQAGGSLMLGASPGSAGETLIACFNQLDSVERQLEVHPKEVAAVILEPVTGSMGVIPPQPGFLAGLRHLCDAHGALLIFDEVLTGFRVGPGGAQGRYGVRPDLTCLGKALAGGFPVGAYGGRRDLMEQVAPLGPVYQAGTFCGNPVTVRAGIAALEQYHTPGLLESAEHLTKRLVEGLRALAPDLVAQHVGSMFSVGFGPGHLVDHTDAARLDRARFAGFFHALLESGVYLPPSTFDAACVSTAHSQRDIEAVLERAREALR